jgi:anthranilate/para-aminobenzoate synthase component II
MNKNEYNRSILKKEGVVLPELNFLLIDNGSDSTNDFLALLTNYKVDVVSFKDINQVNLNLYQLVVLSDGHKLNIGKNTDEIKLIQNASVPIIGICYGFQILCFSYGADLVELETKREGLIKIVPNAIHPVFKDRKSFLAYEKHRFGVQRLPSSLSCLAKSEDGCEVIQVKGKRQFGLQFHPEISNPKNEGKEIFLNLIKFIFEQS